MTWTPLGLEAQAPTEVAVIDVELELEELPREVTDFEGEIRGLWRDGRVYIGGQLAETVFGRLAARGISVVVNLRTPEGMDDRERVPFDEAAVVEALGLEYINIPVGGDGYPYTPAAVDRLADVVRWHDGAVLPHCTVAWRASHLWVAFLVRERGLSLVDAVARGEAMAFGAPPVEGLLGRPLELRFVE